MRTLAILAAVVLFAGGCSTRRDVIYRQGEPGVGLNQFLRQGGEPLHIIFLHGMRATDSGGSATFRAALCARLPGCRGPVSNQTATIRLERLNVSYMGQPVWRSAAEWAASAPIVKRYVYGNPAGAPVVVEEVNWWPLLLPAKCRGIMAHDAPLAGAQPELLKVCAGRGTFADPHADWLAPQTVEQLVAGAGVTGGGAKLNRLLKVEIMDWGLSDAVIAAGPMSEVIGRGVGAALAWTATTPLPGEPVGRAPATRFVVISESLGSFAAFDYYSRHRDQAAATRAKLAAQPSPAAALASEAEAGRAAYGVTQVLDNTDHLYFLANQVALLELARMSVSPPPAPGSLQEPPGPSGLQLWARRTSAGAGLAEPRQIVAFHDPSDILTFEVPPVAGAKVHNVIVANGPTYLGLAADPARAHTAHSRNSCVLQIIFERRASGPCRVAKAAP